MQEYARCPPRISHSYNPPQPMLSTLALWNHKGGVAKTTSAVNLAAAFGQAGRRTLLVDLDPDRYATLHLGREAETGAMNDVLVDNTPIRQIIQHTDALGVDLAPADAGLSSVHDRLIRVARREDRLKKSLRSVSGDYDYIIIDCPPGVSLLQINALVAADRLLIPTTADKFSGAGIASLLDELAELEDALGPGEVAQLLGVFLTIADYRSNLTRDAEAQLRADLPHHMLRTVVRVNAKLREAQMYGQTIFDFDAKSTGAFAYAALAAEIEGRLNHA